MYTESTLTASLGSCTNLLLFVWPSLHAVLDAESTDSEGASQVAQWKNPPAVREPQ